MHAATKAGTLGAGLVIIGTVISHGATDATDHGHLTILFLLLTVPVAGHLLGRAAYVSGAAWRACAARTRWMAFSSARPLARRTAVRHGHLRPSIAAVLLPGKTFPPSPTARRTG